jgi:hypothetical protein
MKAKELFRDYEEICPDSDDLSQPSRNSPKHIICSHSWTPCIEKHYAFVREQEHTLRKQNT